MVIGKIDVKGFALLKPEYNPPVGLHRHGMKSQQLALKRNTVHLRRSHQTGRPLTDVRGSEVLQPAEPRA